MYKPSMNKVVDFAKIKFESYLLAIDIRGRTNMGEGKL